LNSASKILLAVLIISISVNALIFSFYLDKHTLPELFDRFFEKVSSSPLELPQIPEIYKNDLLIMSYDNKVKQKDDFKSWKNEVVTKFIEIYKFPDIDEIEIKKVNEVSVTEKDNYLLTKFSTKAQDNDNIIFYQLVPKKIEGSLPAVLIIPGSGNQGAADVLNEPGEFSKYYYHKGIGEQLVNSGYVVFVIENRGWGERTINPGFHCGSPDVFCSGNILNNQLQNLGYNLFTLQVIDTIQVLKFIQTLDHIDSDRIAVAGLSLGGPISISTSVLVPEVSSTIIASGLVSIYHTGIGITPGLLRYFDFPDLALTLAPKPLYLSWGKQEQSGFGVEARDLYAANLIKNGYALLDSPENLVIIIHEDDFNQGHTFDIETLTEFLDNTIGKNRIEN